MPKAKQPNCDECLRAMVKLPTLIEPLDDGQINTQIGYCSNTRCRLHKQIVVIEKFWSKVGYSNA